MTSPVTGGAAYSNNPDTWASFDDALSYMKFFSMSGIALALSDGIEFIDIDHAVDRDTGEVKQIALELLGKLPDTYAELSTSGAGIHIFCYGNHPSTAKNRNQENNVEMYDHGRFCCFTGNVLDNRKELIDYSDIIEDIAHRYAGGRPEKHTVRTCGTVDSNDTELINRIVNSRQAAKFRNLYSGNISGYNDNHSKADSAFVWLLAFWTRDRTQIDRIFRSSGLYRDKWDRNLYDTTYGEDMIDSALQHVRPHKNLEAY